MGTLAIQAEIGVWVVQAPGSLAGVWEYHSRKNADIAYAKSCNLVHFGVHKHLNNGNEMTADEHLFQEVVIYSRAGIGSWQMSTVGFFRC